MFGFLPATFRLAIGYFVLFSSTKAEGSVQKFGRILSYWVFILASFFPIMGAYATLSGLCSIGKMMSQMGMQL
jgi:hypothetical protein